MNDKVKIGDYVYITRNNGFDYFKKYKVAYVEKNRIIVESDNGWVPISSDLKLGLQANKRYWYSIKWLICSHGMILDNE